MARGASFDPGLEERIGDAIGREIRAVGATFYGGVCVNLLRHPAWGRAQETYGEDPFHVGEMGAALARGVQRHAMACVKHFACNSMENSRFKVDVTVDERALHEAYLPHFKRVVEEGVASVMSAYNSVNGEWCGQNAELLTGILRDEWGFGGFVISDFQFGLRDPVLSVRAGLDIEMPYRQLRHQHLPAAVANGTLAVADIDRAVERIIATLLRFAHVFDEPEDRSVLACEAHRALAREAAEKSIVLLRNEGELLPLDALRLRRLVVIGELASIPNIGDRGSSNVHPPYVVTPLEGLRAALPGVGVHYDEGRDPQSAMQAAAEADAVVVIIGYTHQDEGEYVDPAGVAHLFHLFPPMTDPSIGERLQAALQRPGGGMQMSPGGDRQALTLRESHEGLIEAVVSANPRTIVVVMGGSAVVMERWRHRVPAILMLWYPGMEGGHALANVLLGRVNPSGRLPFAIPTRPDHLPPFDRDATKATYDLWHGQWKLDRDRHAAAFPFGYGLSYTTFSLRDLSVFGQGTQRTVRVTVANTGNRRGADVVQVYGGLPSSRYERPARRLLGFTRLELSPGESRQIGIVVSLRTLAIRDNGRWLVEPGRYEITVGHYANDPTALVTSTDWVG
jgi:beta-glucosidase